MNDLALERPPPELPVEGFIHHHHRQYLHHCHHLSKPICESLEPSFDLQI